MSQRSSRYFPPQARLVRLEEGPPMYRMLGYADKNNLHSDLRCPTPVIGYTGPFATPRLPPNQQMGLGPSRFGLPTGPLAYTTYYWDPCVPSPDNRPLWRMYAKKALPEERPEAIWFPEMAVPGTGMRSMFKNSGYRYIPGIPPP